MADVDWNLTWSMVTALATAWGSIVVTAAAWFGIAQLREAARSRYAEVLQHIRDLLSAPEFEAARKRVRELEIITRDSVSDEDRRHIEIVTRSYDQAGFILYCKLIPEEYVLPEYMGAPFYWEKLKDYIAQQRFAGKYEARRFFEHMAKQTVKFRNKHGFPPVTSPIE